jgi:N-acetylglucosamine-6-phosphate deacetylase
MNTLFFNGKILIGQKIVEKDLWISNGIIVSSQQYADTKVDLNGMLVAPGFIDLQINGGFGYDFSSNVDCNSAQMVAKQLPKHGVTSFLPTIVTSSKEYYKKLIPHFHPRKGGSNGAEILGIHLEGPFINIEMGGAHDKKFIRPFNGINTLKEFYGTMEGVRLVTLAPELSNAIHYIKELTKHHIVVSAGHSKATYQQMQEGIQAGVSFATHLFNAMPSFHKREPGIVGAVLEDSVFFSLIVDGHHLHNAAIKLAWKANPRGLILISDAISALGMPEGKYKLGESSIEVANGKVVVEHTLTIAGSVLSMDQAVRNFHAISGCSAGEALEAASTKPAKLLNLYGRKGTLEFGADADFVILDERLFVQQTYVNGIKCFSV